MLTVNAHHYITSSHLILMRHSIKTNNQLFSIVLVSYFKGVTNITKITNY